LSPFFHCSTGDIFGYKVIEPFGTILFRTGDIVALSTVGSEMTPMCKATVNSVDGSLNQPKDVIQTLIAVPRHQTPREAKRYDDTVKR